MHQICIMVALALVYQGSCMREPFFPLLGRPPNIGNERPRLFERIDPTQSFSDTDVSAESIQETPANSPSISPSSSPQSQRQQGQRTRRLKPKAIADSIFSLGVSLSQKESLKTNGNVVLSPLSIGSILAVILLGARRNTYDELKKAMKLQALTDAEIHESFQKILGDLSSKNKEVLLEIASRLYVQTGSSVEGLYLQIAEAHYNITINDLDFISSPSEALRIVNQWVSDRTHNKINELIQKPFSRDTRFVAVNAVYFNGEWETQFTPSLTKTDGLFRVSQGKTIRIPFMRNVLPLKHISDRFLRKGDASCDPGKFDMVAIPYKGKQFSMYILLPGNAPSSNKLTQIERSLTPDCLNSLISNMQIERVSLQIPRMKISSKMSLKDSLRSMNVNSLFISSSVDLGRMSSTPGMFVKDIQHEAILEVTEVGTLATAATGTSLDRIGGHLSIKMDKPSILFIRDDINGVILFWAKVVEPVPL